MSAGHGRPDRRNVPIQLVRHIVAVALIFGVVLTVGSGFVPPPFDAGTPKTAPSEVHQMMGSMFDPLVAGMRASAKTAIGA